MDPLLLLRLLRLLPPEEDSEVDLEDLEAVHLQLLLLLQQLALDVVVEVEEDEVMAMAVALEQ